MDSIEILLVEDSIGDIRLTKEGLKEAKLANNLHVCRDGVEAMKFLNREGDKYKDVPRPDLILLDLNMPRMNGQEVLVKIKEDESLRTIPVVILTTSDAEQDVMQSYSQHANCYITKPVGLDKFLDVIQSIQGFWLSIVKLPTKN